MKNGKNYQPPLVMTPEILALADAVAGKIERVRDLDLRAGRIRAIRGSLAISGNALSEEQIAGIREGRFPHASAREIREARNALDAYDRLGGWTPHVGDDLLAAHGVLMSGLLGDAGRYRRGALRIASGARILHAAPPAERVPELMEDLLDWLRRTDLHPLVRAAAFHYEFEFIHPFADGNGRLGRLWQTAILCCWNPLFAGVPADAALCSRKEDYFGALKLSTRGTNCAPFIELMLSAILDALGGGVEGGAPDAVTAMTPPSGPVYLEAPASRPQIRPSRARTPFSGAICPQGASEPRDAEDGSQTPPPDGSGADGQHGLTSHIRRLLEALFGESGEFGEMSGQELQAALGLRDRKSFRERYITPALQAGFIEMTVPDKPNSRLQRYRLSGRGRRIGRP